jgi:uncharacterized protein (DUF433 family)
MRILLDEDLRRRLAPVTESVISCRPDVMGGTPVFAGTWVPVQALLDNLEAGDSIDEFLAGFPAISREQVSASDGVVDHQERRTACVYSDGQAGRRHLRRVSGREDR